MIASGLLLAINLSSLPLNLSHSPGIWDSHPSTPAPVAISPEVRMVGNLDAHVRDEIHDGRASGELSHSQARQLARQADGIETLAGRYSQGGLSDSELGELRSRLEALSSLIYVEAAEPLP
jgi:hypothetical protein